MTPNGIVTTINDPRITLHQHTTNWGPVRCFNHAFADGPEEYASILEDDNWWEPTFLETAITAARAEPLANVVWSNMKIWQEYAEDNWSDTGQTVWNVSTQMQPRLFFWPEPLQMTNAIHSNGAMVFRRKDSVQVPPRTPFAIIEPVRERLMLGGWLLLPQPLAHFAMTLATARSNDRADWVQSQLLVAASYLTSTSPTSATLDQIWAHQRSLNPPGTNLLFLLGISGLYTRAILRAAKITEWARFMASTIRHPIIFIRALRFRSDHHDLWKTLQVAAAQRTHEAQTKGSVTPTLYSKTLSSKRE